MGISTNQVSSVVLRPKKLELRKKIVKTVKEPKNKTNTVPSSSFRSPITPECQSPAQQIWPSSVDLPQVYTVSLQ
jgi:hypothetical protein